MNHISLNWKEGIIFELNIEEEHPLTNFANAIGYHTKSINCLNYLREEFIFPGSMFYNDLILSGSDCIDEVQYNERRFGAGNEIQSIEEMKELEEFGLESKSSVIGDEWKSDALEIVQDRASRLDFTDPERTSGLINFASKQSEHQMMVVYDIILRVTKRIDLEPSIDNMNQFFG
jgi:hypothetical protein